MPSTYSTSLRLELIGNGEQAGNWGNTNNINLGTLLEQAIAGVESIAISGASYTLTAGNGVSDQARNAVIVLTGTLAANCNVIVPTVDKTYTFRNATTGGFSVVVKTAAGSGVTIANGFTQSVYCDATNVVAAGVPFNNATNTISGNVAGNVTGNLTGNVTGSASANVLKAGDTMTGALGVVAGTAAAPGVFVSGDTNTGLFQPAADTLAITVGGVEVGRFGANGLQSAAPWVDLASAATTDLGAQTSDNLRITGTTTITSFGTAANGVTRNLRFAAVLTLTHNATSLILPGGANITTAAGDTATAKSLGSGNWVVVDYQRATGLPVVATATGASLITAADAAAARTAIAAAADIDNRWVQLASTNITAVNQIDLTWTGGAYLLYKIYILGLRPGAATANDFFMRVRRGGSFIAGATDYINGYSWWNGTAVGNSSGADSGMVLAQGGMAAEPLLGEISLMQAGTAERITIDAKTRYTANSGGVGTTHSRAIFTSNIVAGTGWLDGARFTFVGGATNFAAVGKIVVLGMKS